MLALIQQIVSLNLQNKYPDRISILNAANESERDKVI